jgi:hypothetical protein
MIKKLPLALFFLSLLNNYNFAQVSIPKDTSITLDENPGFFGFMASCPFYKLSISADGTVELEPIVYKNENEQYKVISGKIIKSKISPNQLNQIIGEFEKVDYYSLKNTFESTSKNNQTDCPQYIPDAPIFRTSITINGKSKSAEHYRGCRGTASLSKLTNLEIKITEIVNINQWFDCYMGKNKINLPF